MYNLIKSIDETSPIRGRVQPGDALAFINGNRITDVLDYKFFAYDRELDLVLKRPDGSEYSLHVSKCEGGDLGIDFESYLMDRPRSCANNCIFCFIDQLPPGMRKTMYFKDDDARLSFLLGNYITLTNFSDREVQRVIDLRISPVNVSVHTTNPELRKMMLGNPHAARSLDIMKRFAENGIVMNCQIVCCRGINDGRELLRTMRDLEAMYPAVHTVSIVPFGMTKYREGLYPIEPFDKETAAEVLDLVTDYSDGCLQRHGTRIFWCGDELYLKAERELPDDEFYENYTQFENGVGMLRTMETEFRAALRMSDGPGDTVPFSIATGMAAAPLFEKLVCAAHEKYDKINGKVYAIENDFFGHSITVAGLITGGDLIRQLKGRDLGERLFITQNMIRREERDFLDDVTLAQASEELGVPIIPIETDGFAVFDAICGVFEDTHRSASVRTEEEFYKYN